MSFKSAVPLLVPLMVGAACASDNGGGSSTGVTGVGATAGGASAASGAMATTGGTSASSVASTTGGSGGAASTAGGSGGVASTAGGAASTAGGSGGTSTGIGGTTGGSTGDGGTGGTGDGGTGGGGEDLSAVAAELHGHTILMPCEQDTEVRVCRPLGNPCNGGGDPALAGECSHDETVTIGGTAGTMYNVTLRIRGLVEGKTFQNGSMDRDSSGSQIPADGLSVGGEPNNGANGYNIYMIRVASPAEDFFLNSIAAGGDTRIRHSLFEIDFMFDLPVEGGTTVRLVSADPNNSAIKNCADPDQGSVCNPQTLPNLDPLIAADVGSQPYNGQFVGVTVESVSVAP